MIRTATVACCWSLMLGAAQSAMIADFDTWSKVEDPPDLGMSAEVTNPTTATLTATGSITPGTDIGYASVDRAAVPGSLSGHYFSQERDFSVAVDFDLSFLGSLGTGAIGLGIGTLRDGSDSAGVGLGFEDGVPLLFSAAARANNIDKAIVPFINSPVASGRLFVTYDSITGDVILGVSEQQGAATHGLETVTYAGIQNEWEDQGLLVSFFLRSQGTPGLTSGEVTAVFTNFEVLSGAPIAVPEPAASLSMILVVAASRRPRRHARG